MPELVVIAGQSNALVFNLKPEQLPAWAAVDPHVQIWTPFGFETMEPGVNTGTANYPSSWGPEVSFAQDWTGAHPGDTLYLVKSVKGSTGLVAGAAPNWSPEQPPLPDGTPNGMFNKTTAIVNAAKAAIHLPVGEVLWMQGEQDAADPGAAGAYQAHLFDVFAHMRSDWGADEIAFGRIAEGLPYANAVREAQADVAAADPHTILLSTDGLEHQDGGLHLAAGGALALGDAFFAADVVGHVLASHALRFAHGAVMEGWF